MPLRVRVWRQVFGLKFVDTILKQRAERLLRTTGLLEYYRDGGWYLDIGTGAGHIVERIVANTRGGGSSDDGTCMGVRYLALDPVWRPTGRVLRRWRRRDRGRLLFVRGDGTRLPVDDESVDGVSLFFVLHHIPYDGQSRVIDEATRVMKPGGRLFLLEDTPENKIEWEITVRRDRRLNFEGADEEHYYRSGDEWRQMLTEKGLVVEKEVYFEENGRAADNGTTRHRCFILRRARERERERQRDRDRDRDRARAQERD